jgi:hypothetical protein
MTGYAVIIGVKMKQNSYKSLSRPPVSNVVEFSCEYRAKHADRRMWSPNYVQFVHYAQYNIFFQIKFKSKLYRRYIL